MKHFTQWEIEQALAHAAAGGQALHIDLCGLPLERATPRTGPRQGLLTRTPRRTRGRLTGASREPAGRKNGARGGRAPGPGRAGGGKRAPAGGQGETAEGIMRTTPVADKGARPRALAVLPDGIPGELRRLNRWVLWRYEWDDAKGKWGKPPVSPATGHKASWLKPGKWAPFDLALEACAAGKGKADGLGLVLSAGADDPLDLAVIDLDAPGLEDALRPLGTYCETSPTGGKGGCHAWVRGPVPPGVKNVLGRAEVYTERQYICVTGRRLGHSGAEIARPDPDTLAAVLRSLGVLGATPAPTQPPPVGAVGAQTACAGTVRRLTLDGQSQDDVLLQAAYRASNGADIRRLMDGDITGYASQSDADIALVNHLEFYFRDEAAIDRIFRRSGLMRPKWDEVHYATGETYGQHTIRDAIKTGGAHYGDRRRTSNGAAVGGQAPTAPTGGGGGPPGVEVAPRPGANGHVPAAGVPWVSAADLPDDEPDYFWEPYIERGILSLLCGRTGAGKSTLLAHLAGLARRPAFLPGFEEGKGSKLRRRLAAAGVNLGPVRVLRRRYYLPSQAQALLADLRAMGADLCIIDPMISYLDPGLKSTDEDAVRPFLEALAGVAEVLGAPVVGVRHSGKGRNPVKGSTGWEEVPRSILELLQTQDGQARRVLRHYKAGGEGPAAPPAYFDIAGPRGAGRFVLGRPVDPVLARGLDAACDPEEGSKVEEVCGLIKVLMSEGDGRLDKREASWMLAYCQRQVGCSAATVQRARRQLGVTSESDHHGPGTKHYWHPPEGGRWPE